jgi:uncharacterized protein YndB with AHSA1/START domain
MAGSGRHQLVTTTPSDLEIVMTRVFDAPRELVFEAHTSCEHLSNWWGPRQYEVLECDVDFRPGGTWKVVHRGADGNQITFFGEYLEIVRPEKIVWTFNYNDQPGGPETYLFEEHEGKTTITSRAVFPSKDLRDWVLQSGMESGARETYERLDEYLEVLGSRANR